MSDGPTYSRQQHFKLVVPFGLFHGQLLITRGFSGFLRAIESNSFLLTIIFLTQVETLQLELPSKFAGEGKNMQVKAKQTKRTRSYLHKLQKEAVTHTATPNDVETSPSSTRVTSNDSLLSARSLVDEFENLHRLKHVPLNDVRITQIREKLEEIMPEVYKRTNTLKSSTREKNIKDFAESVLSHFPGVDLDAMRPKAEVVREVPQLNSTPGASSSSLGFAVSSTFNNLRDVSGPRKPATSPANSNAANVSRGSNEAIEANNSSEFPDRTEMNGMVDFNVHKPKNNIPGVVKADNGGNLSNQTVGNTTNAAIAVDAADVIGSANTSNTPPSVHSGPNATSRPQCMSAHGNAHVGRVNLAPHVSHAGIGGRLGTRGVQLVHVTHSAALGGVGVPVCSGQQNVSPPPMYQGIVGPAGMSAAEQRMAALHNDTHQPSIRPNMGLRDGPPAGVAGIMSGAIGADGRESGGSTPPFSGISGKFMEVGQGISSHQNVTMSQRALMCAVHDVSEGLSNASGMISDIWSSENEARILVSPAGLSPTEVELLHQGGSEGRFGLGINME